MRVRIHRGARQIGGSCVEVEQGGHRIALDFGLPLDGDADDEGLLPPLPMDGLHAIVVSHPHIDHYGLLHHLGPETVVAMGEAARRIVRAAAPFTGQSLPALDGPRLESERPLTFGPFTVTPYLVDHSAYDAYSVLIESGGKRLFYTGDFRAHGRKGKLFERMLKNPPGDIDVLLLEGTTLTRSGLDAEFPDESDLEMEFVHTMRDTTGLVMVLASAQNIDRMVTLFRAARQAGRTLMIDLYAAAILEATGNPNVPQSDWQGVALFVPESQRRMVKRNGWFDLLDRHQHHRIFPEEMRQRASQSVILFRPMMMKDLERADVLEKSSFIYSQWPGYLETDVYLGMQDWLSRLGIPLSRIHTSGHASPCDLQRFAFAMRPKAIVPIHSFAPERYDQFFANIVRRDDGEWWDV